MVMFQILLDGAEPRDAVERKSFKSVGSQFHARGEATEKALSPIFQLVLGTTKSPLLNEFHDNCEGMSGLRQRTAARHVGRQPQ